MERKKEEKIENKNKIQILFPSPLSPDNCNARSYLLSHPIMSQASVVTPPSAQQQQHYGRMPANSMSGHDNLGGASGGIGPGMGAHGGVNGQVEGNGNLNDENRRVLEWIAQMMRPETRESALLELSKKREQVPELAMILWHSFGMTRRIVGAFLATATNLWIYQVS